MSGREGDHAARKRVNVPRDGEAGLTRAVANCSATMGCADLSAG